MQTTLELGLRGVCIHYAHRVFSGTRIIPSIPTVNMIIMISSKKENNENRKNLENA